ncbi:MAG: hypothetical protein OEW99_12345 [Gammaproteobacteria bacterium]|nr:hypothetical protein [Gammaproteobacteria bacterium]
MNSDLLKIILMCCLIFQVGCGIKLKQKVSKQPDAKIEIKESSGSTAESIKPGIIFSKKDSRIITSYYSNRANALIRKDMIRHGRLSKEQKKLLAIGNIISHDIQVIPLPLKLERLLSSLPLNVLRVQVDTRVILMNVKSRIILDVITI